MYSFKIINDHLIVDIAGQPCLLDTGSPVSFGISDTIVIGGRENKLQQSGFGVSIEAIAAEIGVPIVALIGGDILSRLGGLFVWNFKEELHFSTSMADSDAPVRFVQNIPIIPITIAEQTVDACIDTGAPHSYVTKTLAKGHAITGQITDFYPTMGSFTADTVTLDIVDPHTKNLAPYTCAVLPDSLASLMALIDCQVILGLDWLRYEKSHFKIGYRDKIFSNY
jgi:hypothetical protein